MRVAVILLVGLGLLAAACATVLVRVMVRPRVADQAKVVTDPEVSLLTANGPLNAMTVVDGRSVTVQKVKKSELPEGALSNTVQVIGKVITRPMVEGEAFTKSCFASDSLTGVYLASAVPEGKRAITVNLQESYGMAGILYPGSVVDVLVSLENPNGGGQAIATTLLQGLQVLAIGSQTVTSEQEFEDKGPGALTKKQGSVNHRMVTVLVTPKQAEVLQLAMLYGTVSLSMRNPLDVRPVNHQLTQVSDFTEKRGPTFGDRLGQLATALLANAQKKKDESTPPTTAVASAGPPSTDPFAAPGETKSSTNPLWEMLIVRGTDAEKRSFPMSEVEVESGTNEGVNADPAPAN